jgi:hypothetical protein
MSATKRKRNVAKPTAATQQLTKREVRAIRENNPRALAHLGGSFLVRAGLVLLPDGHGRLYTNDHTFESVDLANIGAAVLQLVDVFDAKELFNKACVEVSRGFAPGRVADNEASYLFKDRFARASYECAEKLSCVGSHTPDVDPFHVEGLN